MTGFGLSTSIYNYMSDHIINPEERKALENNFYPKDIADRVPDYIRVVVLYFIFWGIIVVIFLFPVTEEKLELDKTFENVKIFKT
jgi:hypothetical protein